MCHFGVTLVGCVAKHFATSTNSSAPYISTDAMASIYTRVGVGVAVLCVRYRAVRIYACVCQFTQQGHMFIWRTRGADE